MGFSVLMSVYHKEKPSFLREALDSVINQTLRPDEIVLIKDGPLTSELDAVINDIQQQFPALVTYQFEQNVQLGRALAKGVELCSHELIARMDTDDISLCDRFEIQYTYMMKHPECAVCGGWIEEFFEGTDFRQVKRVPDGEDRIREYAKLRNPLNHVTVMFRKNIILQCGNYRHFPYMEDYDLWLRLISRQYKLKNMDRVLVMVRTYDAVYARRGGRSYFKTYKKLRKNAYDLGIINRREYVKALVLTAGFSWMPSSFRRSVYKRILRK